MQTSTAEFKENQSWDKIGTRKPWMVLLKLHDDVLIINSVVESPTPSSSTPLLLVVALADAVHLLQSCSWYETAWNHASWKRGHLYLTTNWQHQKPGSKRNSSGWFWWFYKLGIHCQLVLYPSKRYWLLDLLKQGTSGLNGIILFAAVVQYSRPRKLLGLGPLMQQGGTQVGEASSIVRHFDELENPHVYNSCQQETSAMPHETSGKGTCWMHGWLTTGFNSYFLLYIYIYVHIRACMHAYMHTYIALLHGIAWHYMLTWIHM